MFRSRIIRIWALALGLCLGSALTSLAGVEWVPVLDASLAASGGNYSAASAGKFVDSGGNTLPGRQSSSSGDLYTSFSPNFRFTELPNLWITPSLEFEYTGANNLLSIEDEAFLFNKRLNLYWLLGANYAFNDTWAMKAKYFGRLENVAEAADETLETGLYDYRDQGGWLEGSALYSLLTPMRTKLGYKGYARRYPNYSNQDIVDHYVALTQTVGSDLPPVFRGKDVNVNEVWLRQEISWGDLPLLTNLEARYRSVAYTEMPVILEDGTLAAEPTALRHDNYLDLGVELPIMLGSSHQFELDYTYRRRISNQNVYDTSGAEPVFLGGYYNYYQNSLRVVYSAVIGWKLTGFPAKASVSFGLDDRQYTSRPARQKNSPNDSIGGYNFGDPHREVTTDFGLTLRQQLFASWFNLFASLHAIGQTSNTNVNDNAPYNFSYTTFTLGTAFSF